MAQALDPALAGTAGTSAAEPPRARHRALRRFFRHRLAMIGLGVIIFLVLASVIGPHLIPFDDLRIDMRHRFQAPFMGPHILGSDPLGRDQLARLMMAGRISLAVGFAAMILSTALGTVIGAVAGFYGRLVGTSLMRFVDAMLCFPSIFLLLTLAAFIHPSVWTITAIIAATSWMEVARVVEAQFRSLQRARLCDGRPDDRRVGRAHHAARAAAQRGGARSSSPPPSTSPARS